MTPFGIFIIIRIIIPSIWIFNYLFNSSNSDKEIVFFHFIYLFLLLVGFNSLFNKFLSFQNKLQLSSVSQNVNNNKNGALILLLSLIFIISFLTPLPLFQEGGSDAIVLMQNESSSKTSTWLFSGTLLVLSYPLYFLIFLERKSIKKFLYIFILIFISISSGKKAGMLDFLSTIILVASVYIVFEKTFGFKKIILFIFCAFLTLFFAFFQFYKTLGLDISGVLVSDIFLVVYNLTTNSFSSYLEQIHNLNGINYISIYSNALGDFGSFKYFFNSFIKIISPSNGIDKSIGPFLNKMIYDSEIPNGVNPTLFYEFIFIFGSKYFAFLSFIFVPFILFFISYLYLLMFFNAKILNIYSLSIFLFFIKFFLYFLNDTLNAIRSLPFVLILFLFSYLRKVSLK